MNFLLFAKFLKKNQLNEFLIFFILPISLHA